MNLLRWLTARPIAHRGLHDSARGIPENSLAAARAAAAVNFAIEMDVHLAADGVPVVFHDLTLDRMTGRKGRVRDLTAAELGSLRLGGSAQTIATLKELLEAVNGTAGLVLELKGLAELEDADFARNVAATLSDYEGEVAVMSFNHWLLREFDALDTGIPLGLTAEGNDRTASIHEAIDAEIGFDFLSYGITDLPCRFATQFRKSGRPVITWTVRSPEVAAKSAKYADQITFEGYLPESANR